MNPKSVKPLTLQDLNKLPTPRLLKYLQKLNKCENNIKESDWRIEEINSTKGIIFKSSNEWKDQIELVKSVLSSRPNII